MNHQQQPEYLDYSKVIAKLTNTFPGLSAHEESGIQLGKEKSYTIILLKIPGFQFVLPVAKFSNNSIIRRSFESVAKKIGIDIEEFDKDCSFQDN